MAIDSICFGKGFSSKELTKKKMKTTKMYKSPNNYQKMTELL